MSFARLSPLICAVLFFAPAAQGARIGLDEINRMKATREAEARRQRQQEELGVWVRRVVSAVQEALRGVSKDNSREAALVGAFEELKRHAWVLDLRGNGSSVTVADIMAALADAVADNEQELKNAGAYRTPAPPADSEQGEALRMKLMYRDFLLMGADLLAVAAAESLADQALAASYPRLQRYFKAVGKFVPWIAASAIVGGAVWGLGWHWADVSGAIHYATNTGWYNDIKSSYPDWSATQIWQYMASHEVPPGHIALLPLATHVGVYVGGILGTLYGSTLAIAMQDVLEKQLDETLARLRERHKNANDEQIQAAVRQASVANQVTFESRLMDRLGKEAAKALLEGKAPGPAAEEEAQLADARICATALDEGQAEDGASAETLTQTLSTR